MIRVHSEICNFQCPERGPTELFFYPQNGVTRNDKIT